MTGKHVVVTTKHRGVFFGVLEEQNGGSLTLTDARNCVYWDHATKGYLGLAAKGPQAKCKITDAAPRLTLYGITSVVECSDEAVEAWEAAPWS